MSKKSTIQGLAKSIIKTFGRYTQNERTTTKEAIEIGKKLNKLKSKIKKRKNKKNWEAYATQKFPQIHAKKRQRFMRLAGFVNLKKHPSLSLLGQNQLMELSRKSKKETIGEYLIRNEINLPVDMDDASEVTQFQKEINSLMSKRNETSSKNPQVTGEEKSHCDELSELKIFLNWTENYKDLNTIVPEAVIPQLETIAKRTKILLNRHKQNKKRQNE